MEKLQVLVETLEQKRSKWLLVNLVGFCIWDGLRIVNSYLLDSSASPTLVGIMLAGCLIWIITLIQLVRLGKEMKRNNAIGQFLNDELIELNRLKTWRATLVALVMTQVLILVASLYVTQISGILAAELSIFVAVASAIGGFLYFNRELNE